MAKEEYLIFRKTYDSEVIVEYAKNTDTVYETYLTVTNGKITLTKRIQGKEIIKKIDLGYVTQLLAI